MLGMRRMADCATAKPSTTIIGSAVCQVCEGELLFERHPWLLRCKQCGFLASTLKRKINAPDRRVDEARRAEALRPIRRANFDKVLDALARVGLPASARILDVGCAHGWFLQQAAARGYRPLGIEPDHAVADVAMAGGADVRIGLFPDILADGEQFDAIVFNDVLEHLPNVATAVTAVRRHLSPGGFFVANIPLSSGFFYNLASWLDHLGIHAPFERMWQKPYPSPHVSYFSASQLAQLAERNGFMLLEQETLTSLRIDGLWERLRTDRATRIPAALLIWAALALLAPMLRLLPQDIGLFTFGTR
jgi:2-polyprenyl-3-methyl-5-hydroxy-6-metoxy-1,4-benzoquinol methylase